MTRRRGFTLIELLVVIAIIGILAAMLFPVFARARESARKTQCLANVKNIALAINMYLTDYERFFPLLVDKGTAEWFNAYGVGRGRLDATWTWPDICNHARQANPYLREPVILEDYTKNRDIWRCPSGRFMTGATAIVPVGRNGYWVNGFIDHPNFYTDWMVPPCGIGWPTGWGGDVTDSFVQGMAQTNVTGGTAGGQANAFVQGVGINDNLHWETQSSIQDIAHYVSVSDSGIEPYPWNLWSFAWPDVRICGLSYGSSGVSACGTDPGCCQTNDPDNCGSFTASCGMSYDDKLAWYKDVNLRKSRTRHMGGVNLGFVDGHAKWFSSEYIATHAQPWEGNDIDGICSCWPGNGVVDPSCI